MNNRNLIKGRRKKCKKKPPKIDLLLNKYVEHNRKPSKNDFIQYLTINYSENREYYRNSTILFENVDNPEEKLYIKPVVKYSGRYEKQVFYKVYPLRDLKLYAFMTLTDKMRLELLKWHNQMLNGLRNTWNNCRTKFKDLGLKDMEIFKTYELTKAFTLHAHIALFSMITKDQLQAFCEYYHRKYGLQKTYFYENHKKRRYRNAKTGRYELGMEADVYKSWIHDETCKKWCRETHTEGFEWIFKGEKRIDRVTINYLVKYMVKLPSKQHQAVLRAYNVRTYDPSKALKSKLAKIAKPQGEKNWVKIGILDDCDKEGRYLDGEKVTKEQKIYEKPRSEKLRQYLDSINL